MFESTGKAEPGKGISAWALRNNDRDLRYDGLKVTAIFLPK